MQESPESLKVNFVKEREEAYKRIYKRSPIISSASIGWESLGIAYDWYPVEKVPKIISKQHGIGIFTDLPSPCITEGQIGSSFKREEVVQERIKLQNRKYNFHCHTPRFCDRELIRLNY
ncbi:MAG: hypothetical protein ACFCU7_02915 [Pleurocapsa sp.]